MYVHQYFKTPQEGGAIRSYYIAKGFVQRGFQVDMITSHNNSEIEIKSIDGITVHYLPVFYQNWLAARARYIAFLKFAFKAIRYSKNIPKPDMAYVTSTPLTVGIVALWLKWFHNSPYIFEVRDLWPEAPIQMGILKSKFLQLLAVNLEKTIYKNALHIVALSPGIRDGIITRQRDVAVTVIPNIADIDFYGEHAARNYKNKSSLEIGYFGAMGYANGLKSVIDVAEICQRRGMVIKFILMGDGGQREMLQQMIIEKELTNIQLLPFQSKDEMAIALNRVDACIVSFLNFPVLETCSPNKFFDALAAGKLCITNTNGWMRTLVEENQCGFYYDSENPESFIHLIQQFLSDEALLHAYQRNALALAKSQFSKGELITRVCDLVENTIEKIQ